MDNKPMDETNYGKSRNHAVRSNRVSGRNQAPEYYMGGHGKRVRSVRGEGENPRRSSE
jgi:hypothetical protein